MLFQSSQNLQLLRSQVLLGPGCDHLAHAVMMAQRTATFLDMVEDSVLQFLVFFDGRELLNEDEIQVGALRIKM